MCVHNNTRALLLHFDIKQLYITILLGFWRVDYTNARLRLRQPVTIGQSRHLHCRVGDEGCSVDADVMTTRVICACWTVK